MSTRSPKQQIDQQNPERYGKDYAAGRFSSFKVPGFSHFFLASLFLYGGINSLLVVRGYLVFNLTGSYTDLGTLALATLVPSFFSTLYGGVIADRLPKTLFIGGGLIVMGLFALWLALLIYWQVIALWHVMVSSVVHGFVFGLISAAWYSIVPEVVPRHLIMNAVSINMGGQNITRLIVPALCGFLLGITGTDTVHLLMGLLFIIAGLLMFKVPVQQIKDKSDAAPKENKSPHSSFIEGLQYTRANPAIAALVMANILISALSLPFLLVLPGYVKGVLGQGPEVLGIIVSITSIGALAASVFMSTMRPKHRGNLFMVASLLMGFAFFGFANAKPLWLVYIMVLFIGLGMAIRQSLVATLCQTYVDEDYRGRVSSLLSLQMTAGQLGTFIVGWCSEEISAPAAFMGMGLLLAAVSFLFLLFAGSLRKMQ